MNGRKRNRDIRRYGDAKYRCRDGDLKLMIDSKPEPFPSRSKLGNPNPLVLSIENHLIRARAHGVSRFIRFVKICSLSFTTGQLLCGEGKFCFLDFRYHLVAFN